jgi:hypothetical protein
MAADPCKARGAGEIEERKRTRWHRGEGNGELAVMKTFTIPAGDLPSAGGLSAREMARRQQEEVQQVGESGMGRNGDRRRFPERGWGFYTDGWFRSMVHR